MLESTRVFNFSFSRPKTISIMGAGFVGSLNRVHRVSASSFCRISHFLYYDYAKLSLHEACQILFCIEFYVSFYIYRIATALV
jgi:hypothetical protein